MKMDFILCNESFDAQMRNEEELHLLLENLSDVFRQITINGESIYCNYSWYLQEIIVGNSIESWIWDTSSGEFLTEKLLLQDLIKQTQYIEEEDYNKIVDAIKGRVIETPSSILCLNHIEIYNAPENFNIHTVKDLIDAHRFFIRKSNNHSELYEGLKYCFPSLSFGLEVADSMSIFKQLHDFLEEILEHLSILNDEAMELFHEIGIEKESELMKKLATKVLCSPQGDPVYEKKYLSFSFINNYGIQETVVCAPHTKLFHKGSDYRIYFTWPKENFNKGSSILVGHIGKHL
ncbi:hypothetical protein ACQRXC_08610 [Niallia taxi]|uniref:hypothetical protein n=1 Tax=Niallia taxi TaxID=2499688 RepID=UPI003F6227CE